MRMIIKFSYFSVSAGERTLPVHMHCVKAHEKNGSRSVAVYDRAKGNRGESGGVGPRPTRPGAQGRCVSRSGWRGWVSRSLVYAYFRRRAGGLAGHLARAKPARVEQIRYYRAAMRPELNKYARRVKQSGPAITRKPSRDSSVSRRGWLSEGRIESGSSVIHQQTTR